MRIEIKKREIEPLEFEIDGKLIVFRYRVFKTIDEEQKAFQKLVESSSKGYDTFRKAFDDIELVCEKISDDDIEFLNNNVNLSTLDSILESVVVYLQQQKDDQKKNITKNFKPISN